MLHVPLCRFALSRHSLLFFLLPPTAGLPTPAKFLTTVIYSLLMLRCKTCIHGTAYIIKNDSLRSQTRRSSQFPRPLGVPERHRFALQDSCTKRKSLRGSAEQQVLKCRAGAGGNCTGALRPLRPLATPPASSPALHHFPLQCAQLSCSRLHSHPVRWHPGQGLWSKTGEEVVQDLPRAQF